MLLLLEADPWLKLDEGPFEILMLTAAILSLLSVAADATQVNNAAMIAPSEPISNITTGDIAQRDCEILPSLIKQMGGDIYLRSLMNLTDCCQAIVPEFDTAPWLICSGGRIVELKMGGHHALNGTIPSRISELSSLRRL